LGLRPRPPHRSPSRARSRGHPSRATPHDVTRTADPLLAFPSPTGSDSLDSPRASRRTAPLVGFGPLQRFQRAESTSLASAGPNRPTTFRPQGSRPLDGLLLHPPCPRLSARASLLGFSLQGFPLSNRPASSSLTGPLMAFLPRSGPSPSRTERTGGASRSPKSPLRLLSPTGCCSVRESVPFELPVKVARRPIPSWVSSSLGSTCLLAEGVTPSPLTCFLRRSLRQLPLRVTAAPSIGRTTASLASRQWSSLARGATPSEVSRLQILTRVGSLGPGLPA